MRSLSVSKKVHRKISLFLKKHPTLKTKVELTLIGLLKDPFPSNLAVHKLSGKLNELYAASINYEYRLVFFFDENTLYPVNIGSHDEVY